MAAMVLQSFFVLGLVLCRWQQSTAFLFTQTTAPSKASAATAFHAKQLPWTTQYHSSSSCLYAQAPESSPPELKRIPPDMEGVAIPFVDVGGNSFIECYADSVANVEGVEYTIGVPCDYSVALCYFDEQGQLVPVELDDDELMNDIFPLAESIVSEEFGEELVLQRTPQTLTLVGELEDEDEEEDHKDEDS